MTLQAHALVLVEVQDDLRVLQKHVEAGTAAGHMAVAVRVYVLDENQVVQLGLHSGWELLEALEWHSDR